jgi:hypothetical protein
LVAATGAVAALAAGLGIDGDQPPVGPGSEPVPVAAVASARLATGDISGSPARAGLVAISNPRPGQRDPPKIPSAAALDRARDYAQGRSGVSSFAVVNTDGKLRGRRVNRRYPAASTVKAMLLAAEVKRLRNSPIDGTTDSLLTAMITVSDNEAADAIYARVGDAGLFEIADRAGMTRFTVAGYWGNAQVAAGDLARFFGDLDRVFVKRHREYAKGLLGSITESQRWGIPTAAGDKWAVRFKGGWLPDHALAHQAAELRERHGPRELSIAVLTDDMPSFDYATDTVRDVADRLLSR